MIVLTGGGAVGEQQALVSVFMDAARVKKGNRWGSRTTSSSGKGNNRAEYAVSTANLILTPSHCRSAHKHSHAHRHTSGNTHTHMECKDRSQHAPRMGGSTTPPHPPIQLPSSSPMPGQHKQVGVLGPLLVGSWGGGGWEYLNCVTCTYECLFEGYGMGLIQSVARGTGFNMMNEYRVKL